MDQIPRILVLNDCAQPISGWFKTAWGMRYAIMYFDYIARIGQVPSIHDTANYYDNAIEPPEQNKNDSAADSFHLFVPHIPLQEDMSLDDILFLYRKQIIKDYLIDPAHSPVNLQTILIAAIDIFRKNIVQLPLTAPGEELLAVDCIDDTSVSEIIEILTLRRIQCTLSPDDRQLQIPATIRTILYSALLQSVLQFYKVPDFETVCCVPSADSLIHTAATTTGIRCGYSVIYDRCLPVPSRNIPISRLFEIRGAIVAQRSWLRTLQDELRFNLLSAKSEISAHHTIEQGYVKLAGALSELGQAISDLDVEVEYATVNDIFPVDSKRVLPLQKTMEPAADAAKSSLRLCVRKACYKENRIIDTIVTDTDYACTEAD